MTSETTALEDATQEQVRLLRAAMETYVENTVAAVNGRREFVRFQADESEVRYIARLAIELAVGLTKPAHAPLLEAES